MHSEDSVAFELSQEEVLFLLADVDAQGLLGLDTAPFDALEETQRQQIVRAAMRALRARGMIAPSESEGLVLDETVRTTIHVSAFAEYSLSALVRRRAPDRIETYIVHHAGNLWVEHSQPDAGIHAFRLHVEPPPVQATLDELLGITDQTAPPAKTLHLTSTHLNQLQEAASRDDTDSIRAELAKVTEDARTVELFTDMLLQPGTSGLVQTSDRRNEPITTETMTVIETSAGFWALQSIEDDALYCMPVSADELRQKLSALNTAIIEAAP